MNRIILEIVSRSTETEIAMNSFVFSLLLHEYLHSLGYIDEAEVRRLVHNICIRIFSKDHPTAIISLKMPFSRICPIDMYGREATPYLELGKRVRKTRKNIHRLSNSSVLYNEKIPINLSSILIFSFSK
ncbi:MAG: hypothetical protein QXR42_04310 [Candidatus Bathyarchaeia archaeon]